MSTEILNKEILRGGQFLVKETKCEDVFTLEDLIRRAKNDAGQYQGICGSRNLGTLGTV